MVFALNKCFNTKTKRSPKFDRYDIHVDFYFKNILNCIPDNNYFIIPELQKTHTLSFNLKMWLIFYGSQQDRTEEVGDM